jgi:hypothetical protein
VEVDVKVSVLEAVGDEQIHLIGIGEQRAEERALGLGGGNAV